MGWKISMTCSGEAAANIMSIQVSQKKQRYILPSSLPPLEEGDIMYGWSACAPPWMTNPYMTQWENNPPTHPKKM